MPYPKIKNKQGKLFHRQLEAALDWIEANMGGGGGSEYMVPIWAEENATLGNDTYEWAFGNGASTPADNGIAIHVPSTHTCAIVAVSATTNNAGGTSTIEACVNGAVLGVSDGVEVTLAGRSATNSSFTAYAIADNDRLNFRTRLAGTNGSPNTVCAWLKYTPV